MKIILLGATGQVGRELMGPLPALGEVVACDRTTADLEQPEAVVALLAQERPDVIVNAAAYTAVDKAEQEPERAAAINSTSVAAIAAEACRQDALLVHYSTDYVFDGQATAPYRETDPTGPLSVYGATKLAGEQAIADSGCRHYVLRTSWVYATHGTNFLRTMLRLATERDTLAVVADQWGVPTAASLMAAITVELLQRSSRPESAVPSGLYHLAPEGVTTWHAYATFLLAAARDHGMTLRVNPDSITPLTTPEYPTAARRPASSRLCTEKLTNALARNLPQWQDDVRSAVATLCAVTVV